MIARRFGAEWVHGEISRLVIELNRSLSHPRLWSEFSRKLTPEERDSLAARYYIPYRDRVLRLIREAIARGERVFHLSVHSFTPNLDGVDRDGDMGILFDPGRAWEKTLAHDWQRLLGSQCPECRVRRNFPYRGTSDGLTTALRRLFAPADYAGIELEVNQKFPLSGGRPWSRLQKALTDSLVPFINLKK